MKIFLLVLVCCAAGWFCRDLVTVAWSAPTQTLSVQMPRVTPPAKPAPVQAAPVRTQAPAPKPQPAPKVAPTAQYPSPSGYNLGQHVMASGQWRVNPASAFDENHPGDGWAAGYHGTPHDDRVFR